MKSLIQISDDTGIMLRDRARDMEMATRKIDDKDVEIAVRDAVIKMQETQKALKRVNGIGYGWMFEREKGFMSSVSDSGIRCGKIASSITAEFQENIDKLENAVRVIEHSPWVEDAVVEDYDFPGTEGKIRIGLPVKEWTTEIGTKHSPVRFGIEPKMLADRVSAKLRSMGVAILDVIYPKEMRGMFGGARGYDTDSIVMEVSVA